MTIHLTSDLHLSHLRIAELSSRPFPWGEEGIEAMNEAIVATWNSQVADDDTVYVLGDFGMGRRDLSLEYVNRLNGTKHLISGNHDNCWIGSDRPDRITEWTDRYLEAGFVSVTDFAVAHFDDLDALCPNGVLMSHFPYKGESPGHTEDRYAAYRPIDTGAWLLHGHVHEAWKQRGRQINVGIDAWGGRLVSLADIAALIAAGPRNITPDRWVPPAG